MTNPFYTNDTAGMATLVECLNIAIKHGYTENFIVQNNLLATADKERLFAPEQVKIINFYRFEGASNPDDMSILYIIETDSPVRGVLIDAYGTYAESSISNFIQQVHDIQKQSISGQGS
jgi:hypothetical protein